MFGDTRGRTFWPPPTGRSLLPLNFMVDSGNRPRIINKRHATWGRFGFGVIVSILNRTQADRLDFHIFDAAYVDRLTRGDPDTELHFSSYSDVCSLQTEGAQNCAASGRGCAPGDVPACAADPAPGNGVTQPEAFGAFVSAVCNNVLLETLNKESKHPQIPENAPERPTSGWTWTLR